MNSLELSAPNQVEEVKEKGREEHGGGSLVYFREEAQMRLALITSARFKAKRRPAEGMRGASTFLLPGGDVNGCRGQEGGGRSNVEEREEGRIEEEAQ